MMQAFRSSTKIVGAVMGALLIFWLLGELSGLSSGGLFSTTSVGKINGQTIDTRRYEQAVQEATQRAQQGRSTPLSLEDIQSIRDQIWNQLIQDQVLSQAIKQHDITVTPEEVADAIRNNPLPQILNDSNFHTNGQFDPHKYQLWLQSSSGQQIIPYLESQYRDEIKKAKLWRLVTADVFLSDPALWQKYRDQHEQVKILLTAIVPRTIIPDSAVSVTDAEISQYYNQHQKDFERPETAFLSYIALPRQPDASDTAAALKRARDLRKEIEDGTPFAQVAEQESADSVSAKKGGDLGEWTRGQFAPAFDSAAFSMPLNTVSQPVLTQFGYHLIEVTSRKGDKAKGRHILIPIEVTGAHRDKLDSEADTLDALAAERLDPAALDTVARVLGLRIGKTAPVQQGSRVQVGRYVVSDAGVWAFQAQQGEISPVIESPDAYFLFRLDSTQAAGVPPLNDIRSAVALAVQDKKKWAKARELGQQVEKRLKEGSTLLQVAEALKLPHQEMGPFPRVSPPLPSPELVGTAFGLKKGEVSPMLDTKDGIYFLQVLDHIPADSAAFVKDMDDLRVQAIRQAQQSRIQSYVANLKDEATIVDKRAQLARTNAQIEAQNAQNQGR